MISFIDLADLEQVEIKHGQRFGKTRKDKLLNESSQDVIVVDMSWNKEYISSPGHVDPYFKWQHYGPKMSLRRWQLIGVNSGGFERTHKIKIKH